MNLARVIEALEAGGRIEARRAFPCPHRYWLRYADGHRHSEPLRPSWVVDLVEQRRLDVASHSPNYDQVDYQIRTPAGAR